jgi:hypothetical protein
MDIAGIDGRGPTSHLKNPVGALNDDLAIAMKQALACKRDDAAAYGRTFSWDRCTSQFEDALESAIASKSLVAA